MWKRVRPPETSGTLTTDGGKRLPGATTGTATEAIRIPRSGPRYNAQAMAADRRQGSIDGRCKRQQHQAERDADGVETRFWIQFLVFPSNYSVVLQCCARRAQH